MRFVLLLLACITLSGVCAAEPNFDSFVHQPEVAGDASLRPRSQELAAQWAQRQAALPPEIRAAVQRALEKDILAQTTLTQTLTMLRAWPAISKEPLEQVAAQMTLNHLDRLERCIARGEALYEIAPVQNSEELLTMLAAWRQLIVENTNEELSKPPWSDRVIRVEAAVIAIQKRLPGVIAGTDDWQLPGEWNGIVAELKQTWSAASAAVPGSGLGRELQAACAESERLLYGQWFDEILAHGVSAAHKKYTNINVALGQLGQVRRDADRHAEKAIAQPQIWKAAIQAAEAIATSHDPTDLLQTLAASETGVQEDKTQSARKACEVRLATSLKSSPAALTQVEVKALNKRAQSREMAQKAREKRMEDLIGKAERGTQDIKRLQQEAERLAAQEEADKRAARIDQFKLDVDEALRAVLKAEVAWRAAMAPAAEAEKRVATLAQTVITSERDGRAQQQRQVMTNDQLREAMLACDKEFDELFNRIYQEGQRP